MATLQQSSGKKDGDIRYLTPLNMKTNKKLKKYSFQKIWNQIY
jgi:small subunit ribosomal protein S18